MPVTRFPGNWVLDDDALRLAVRLESAGYAILVEGEMIRLRPGPKSPPLTDVDKADMKRLKPDVLGVLAYVQSVTETPKP